MTTIVAVYENGLLRPKEPLDLPESCEVEIDLRRVTAAPEGSALDEIYAIITSTHESGVTDGAARHDEHQP